MAFAARAALLCALVASTLGVTTLTPQPPLSTVLARMRAAGGTAYAFHIASTTLTDGANGRIFRNDMQGLRFVNRACAQVVCTGTYFDGERAYAINLNDTALPRSTETQVTMRALRIALSLAFLDPAFTRSGGRIVDEGFVTTGGRQLRRLLVGDAASAMTEVYVDPQTWLIDAVGDLDEHDIVRLTDYRRVGTLMLPFELDRDGTAIERYGTREIVAAPLEAPHGLAFEKTDGTNAAQLDPAFSTPVFPCAVGGVRVRCLLDTGNSGLSMSLELAEQLGAPTVGAFQVNGLGRYATAVVRAGPLDVANLRFTQPNFVILHDIHQYGYDVVLGADMLARAAVLLDPARHRIVFNGEPPLQGETLGLGYENLVPVVPVRLAQTETMLAIDTGDESSINLSYEYYRQHSDLFRPTRTENVSGVGGSSVEVIGEIGEMAIAGYVLTNQAIGATQTLQGTAHGHVGAQILSHFTLYVDYPRSRIVLEPRGGDPKVRHGS